MLYFTGPVGIATSGPPAVVSGWTIGSKESFSGGSSGGSAELKRKPRMPPDGGHSSATIVSEYGAETNAGGSGVSMSGKSAFGLGGPGRPRALKATAV